MKNSYDDVISAIDNFLTNEVRLLQHRWKKCVHFKRNYAEKKTLICHIP